MKKPKYTNSQIIKIAFPGAYSQNSGDSIEIRVNHKYGKLQTLGWGSTVKAAWEHAVFRLRSIGV